MRRLADWCAAHRIDRGDIQPIKKIWEFSKVWYGNHLSRTWKKWTTKEASEIFQRFDLRGPIWEIPTSAGRF